MHTDTASSEAACTCAAGVGNSSFPRGRNSVLGACASLPSVPGALTNNCFPYPYPSDIRRAQTHDPQFNNLQERLIREGNISKGELLYYVHFFMKSFPTLENGLHVALAELCTHMMVRVEDDCTDVVNLLVLASQLLLLGQ